MGVGVSLPDWTSQRDPELSPASWEEPSVPIRGFLGLATSEFACEVPRWRDIDPRGLCHAGIYECKAGHTVVSSESNILYEVS